MARRHSLQVWLAIILKPLSWLYGRIMLLRRKAYEHALLSSKRACVPVISVGNISWGGTGKSPIVDYLITYFTKHDKKCVVLTRGYKSKGLVFPFLLNNSILLQKNIDQELFTKTLPDEALMLLEKHKDLDILIDPKRTQAIQKISLIKEKPVHADLILLDDGFQHRALIRDLDIVLLDKKDLYESSFLSSFWEINQNWDTVIPLGSWREPKEALRSADIFLLKCPKKEWENLRKSAFKKLQNFAKPLFLFEMKIEKLIPICINENSDHAAQDLTSYGLICAVGEPSQVLTSISQFMGYAPKETLFFTDHHSYQNEEEKIYNLLMQMPLVCTEKDAVKLSQFESLKKAKFSLYKTSTKVIFYDSLFYDRQTKQHALPNNLCDFDLYLETSTNRSHTFIDLYSYK